MIRHALMLVGLIISVPVAAQSTCRNITAYGGDPSGAAPSDAAFNAAVNASDGTHICVYLPQGLYTFQSTLSVPLNATRYAASITIQGDGAETTQLRFAPEQSGISISLNTYSQSFHIRKISLLAGNKSNTTTALSATNNSGAINPYQNDVTDVIIRGADGLPQPIDPGAGQYRWNIGIGLDRVSNVTVSNSTISGSPDGNAYATAGYGFKISGTSSIPAVQFNIVSSQINYYHSGILYGNYAQGVQVSTSNFVGNYIGIELPNGQQGNDQLAVSSSQFNNSGYGVVLSSLIDGVTLIGNTIYGGAASGGIGVNINNTDQFSIIGNTFINLGSQGPNQNAIIIGAYGASSGMITGNVFKNPFVTAIWLTPGSQYVNVQSNSYLGQSNTVINQGSNNIVGGGTH